MKVVRFIKKLFVGIFLVIFFAFTISMTVLLLNYNDYGVTQINDTSLLIIKEQLSSDKYKKGDLVLVEGTKLDNINIDDELFVYKVDDSRKVSLELGTVGGVHPNDDAVSFKNGSTYASQFIAGKATKVYEKFGFYLSIISSTWGFLFIILIPNFLIFVYQIYALVVEIKYGKDEPVPGPVPVAGQLNV